MTTPSDEFCDALVRCPKCGDEQPDMDGFGFLICDACGYCTHPSASAKVGEPLLCDHCAAAIRKMAEGV